MFVVTSDFRLQAGQNLAITANTQYQFSGFMPGVVFTPNTGVKANFTVAGSLQVSGSVGDIVGLYVVNQVASGAFTIADTGVLRVVSNSIAADGLTFGIYAPQQNIDLFNDGLIDVRSQSGTAIGLYSYENPNGYANGFRLVNKGVLSVTSGLDAVGVEVLNRFSAENDASIRNTGTIEVSGWRSATGIMLRTSSLVHFQNDGEITASVDPTSDYASVAVRIVSGFNDSGLDFPPAQYYANAGLIVGDYAFFVTSYTPSEETVFNTGEIFGHIVLDSDDDRLINMGKVVGVVDLGSGDDVAVGIGGQQFGSILGGSGDDRIVGSDSDETLLGGFGADQISAGGGDDWVEGGLGADALDGGEGFDTLSYADNGGAIVAKLSKSRIGSFTSDVARNFEHLIGSVFGDSIKGDRVAEQFDGLAGADVLSGGAGADTLVGGAGDDKLSGGKGRDLFVFSAGSGRDTVTDFGAGDRVEVHDYTGYQQLSQVGDDVRLVLSAGDKVTFLKTTVATVAQGLSFSDAPLQPELGRPALSQLTVDRDFHLATGETLHIANPGSTFTAQGMVHDLGIVTVRDSYDMPAIYNDGSILIEADTPADTTISLTGISFGGWTEQDLLDGGSASITQNEMLINRGVIEVVNHGGSSSPVGVATAGVADNALVRFWNEGRLTVSAERGDVTGYSGSGLINRGLIEVDGPGHAYGVFAGHYHWETYTYHQQGAWNLGDIVVNGGLSSIGVSYTDGASFGCLFNSGSILVTDQTAAIDSVGVLLEGGSQVFINTGTVTADYAISFTHRTFPVNTSFSIFNSGTLTGRIEFEAGNGFIRNLGAINGDVSMDSYEDVYDGRGGTLSGTVFGLDAEDKLYGGAGVDHLDGGADGDLIAGGGGADVLTGGAGQDKFHFAKGDGADVITDFAAGANGDVIRLSGYAFFLSIQQQGADALVRLSATDTILLQNCNASDLVTANFIYNAAALEDAKGMKAGAKPERTPDTPDQLLHPVAPRFLQSYVGTDGDDVLSGGAGADVLVGMGGDDTYSVDTLRDEVIETADGGDDLVRSRATGYVLESNVERLVLEGNAARGAGNELDNLITGNARNNVLEGGAGDDTLVGGLGADTFEGGAGADLIIIGAGETGDTRATADLIRDFQSFYGDRIDLSDTLAGDEAFTFIGQQGFSHTAGELRWYQTMSDTVVEGDIDGDGVADLVIWINNHADIKANDFIL